MTAPPLATPRLLLTGHTAADLDPLARMWADPGVYGPIGGRPRSREEVWLRLLRSIGQWTLLGHGFWVVRDRDTRAVLGEVGLLAAERAIDPPLALPETGWMLDPAVHGRGLAHEAMRAVLGWADRQGLGATCCIIAPANTPSLTLAARLGYVRVRDASYAGQPIAVLERRAPGQGGESDRP